MMRLHVQGAVPFARFVLASCAFILTACGVASVSEIVRPDEQEFDALLVGRWRDAGSTAFALIRGASSAGYRFTLVDEDGSAGRFLERLLRQPGMLTSETRYIRARLSQ